jgi:FkbM family methyltransferase
VSDDPVAALAVGEIGQVDTPVGPVRFLAQGLGRWRFETLLTKEPETIEWIDGFSPGETLWDIGANLGIYAIYAARRGVKVLAFEPHFANYFQLCLNLVLNQLQDQVTPFCLAFAEAKQVSTINLARLEFGSALSTFAGDLDCRGRPYEPAFRQGMVGYDLDSFIADFGLRVPEHVKIDVDGLELAIARGGRRFFADPGLKSVSIELIDSDPEQVEGVSRIMAEAGLAFVHKKQAPQFNNTSGWDILNFLFRRD